MINKIKSSSLILWTIELLLVVSIIFICTKLDFIFSPIGTFFSAVFIPILISGVLFYMLNPVVNLLMKIHIGKRNMSRLMAIILVFVLLGLLIFYTTYSLMPRIITQVTNLFNNLPSLANDTTNYLKGYSHKGFMKNVYLSDYVNKFQSYIYSYAQKFLSGLTSSIGSVISMAASTVVVLITVPVMLFYMLKDGHKLLPGIAKVLPPKRRDNTIDLLTKMSNTISNYIGGQMIECLFVGVFTSIGYILIGQKYALLLGCFAGICNIIPYVGPYIGIMPSLFVSLSEDITKVIAVVIVVLIVQQIDGNLVYPNVIGKSLNIHPLTIIIILLAAGNISGLLGMILAIPLYAVVKVIVQYVYSIWLLQREKE
ncbi:AI-2E family transporter [Apilactobacillus micheneri]|uniref:AI-2E family transporter n=1 Tax=Apilactobacillus micheneri TaxID=1899430 RepID=A0A9Q8IP34_9LACO|nr:AI-2E family transporter [Apilactobacillus micheneri]TPR40844.1 AI-2E family transporter [Apilactobacillus micheneri]TPR42425.1 AI-2E family transporter [Apilactobacillus micheneri]TPR45394.1 AI-2E family transporter [Apilactobacillus micheneri]TPR45951.1 AI-2E family transporter [Apilactobacillus micheneri]TPR46636.1 AI-2E family transporter [Apilactobacillus micheneri]